MSLVGISAGEGERSLGNPRIYHVRLPVWRGLNVSGAALKGKQISIVATKEGWFRPKALSRC